MRLAAVFSGGKDSTFSVYKAMKDGHEVKYLITASPRRTDSYMFHVPDIEWTRLQADSIGIKHIFEEVSGEKEHEVEELKRILSHIKEDIDGVVSGAIASSYQKNRIDTICSELSLKSIAPLWGVDQEKYVREVVDNGFVAIFSGIGAEGLDKEWLGKELDKEFIDKLVKIHEKYGINIAGEGGEYESFVIDSPIFKKKIKITDSERIWDEKQRNGYFLIKSAFLVDK